MNWLDVFVGETRAQMLRMLRKAASTITELADGLGVSENAVRTHVAAAERDGLVRQTGIQRATGGKPARVYELTPDAEELFPKAYALVLERLVQVVRDVDGEKAVLDRLRRVGRDLAASDSPSSGNLGARVAAAADALESIGGSLSVSEESTGWVLRGDGCPLSAVILREPDVCVLAQSVIAELTGRQVVETCRKSGRPGCEFHVLDESHEGNGGEHETREPNRRNQA